VAILCTYSRVAARVNASLEPTPNEAKDAKLIILEARDVRETSLPLRPFAKEFTKRLLDEEKTLKLLTIQLITGTHFVCLFLCFFICLAISLFGY
jgi:hypothetical protein